MEEISLRQRVFTYMEKYKDFFNDKSISREEKNARLYKELENENKVSIRQYKVQYYEEKEREESLDISLGLNCDNEIKVSIKGRKDNDKAFQIFPLLKTFKLLPLYLFKLTYKHAINLKNKKDFLITNIFCNLIDSMNKGHYKLNEISDFMGNIDKNLDGFLDDDSWKRNLISAVNNWIQEVFFKIETSGVGFSQKTSTKSKTINLSEAYHYIRGKILTYMLPEIYGIYFYNRKREYIIRDFAKACYVMNICKSESVSLTNLIKQYNEDLEFRDRPEKYYIDLGFHEGLEFMNPELYQKQLEFKEKENEFVYGED